MASSNTLLTPTIICREGLMSLENILVMAKLVHREYKKEFAKDGQTVTIRKPNKFRATKAQARSNTNLAEPSTTFTVATQAHVSWAFSSVELTMTIEEYSQRYIQPAVITLANIVDVDLCALYVDVHNEVGTPGTAPSTFRDVADAMQRLDEEAAFGARHVVLNPKSNWSLADGLKGTFAQKPANDILTKGYLGTIGNADFHMDQNIQTHTTGTFSTSATPVVNGGSQTGASLVTNGWNASSSTVKKGDVFTIADSYAVNPVSGASTGELRQFTVTADGTSNAGAMTLSISPSIVTSGAYQTVTASPSHGAALTFVGTEASNYPQNIAFSKNAFGLVTMPIEMPAGVWGARVTDRQTGMSIRVIKQYDVNADEEIVRLDILYGVTTLYPELACRITA